MVPEFKRDNTALATTLAHLYRGEVSRADNWRTRLDNTTNWALTTSAGVLSFGLGSAAASHAVLLVGMFLVVYFLMIEARRYRVWDVYLRRVRLLETGLYAPLLRDERLDPSQLRELASMLEAPRIVITAWAAIGQRIKRAYGPVLVVLLFAWLFKLLPRGRPASLGQVIDAMHVGPVAGWLVLLAVALTYAALGAVFGYSLLAPPPGTELAAVRRRRPRPLHEAFQRPRRPVEVGS